MKLNFIRLFSGFFILLIAYLNSYSQGTTEFEIKMPEKRTEGAKYGKFRFIDQRGGTGFMGFVQTGALNRKSVVLENTSLEQQLSKVFDVLADKTKDAEMLFQTRYCAFSEQTLSMSEHGYFAVRANLYAKKGESYQAILGIDTIIRVSAMDVTNKLLRTGGETLIRLIDSGLKSDPTGKIYSLNEVTKIDSIEKIGFAAYKSTTLTDGIYSSSLSFLLQQPDAKIDSAKAEQNSIVVYITNEKGKQKKLKATDSYAVVHKGEAYITYARNFYKLTRQNNDFVLTINLPLGTDPYTGIVVASTNYSMLGGMNGGAIGGLIGASFDAAMKPRNKEIFIKLDYVTGRLMIAY
jgi:hypothetical protein